MVRNHAKRRSTAATLLKSLFTLNVNATELSGAINQGDE
jgi:hypothetical protein